MKKTKAGSALSMSTIRKSLLYHPKLVQIMFVTTVTMAEQMSFSKCAGAESTFRLAWECARPNAVVTVVALYDKAQTLPLPDMYGKNLTFKTGGVDGCNCEEILRLIAEGRLNTEPLITHTYPLDRIEEAYTLFENKMDGVIKVAIEC